MALLKYLQPRNPDILPSPRGPLSATLSPATIKQANEAVQEAQESRPRKTRGVYTKVAPEQQALIAKYASINGITAAVRRFTKELGIELKESSVRTWKTKYLAEMDRRRRDGETAALKSLPSKKRGRPLLLGETLDSDVKCYIRAVREGGGVVTTSITMAVATAIVRKSDRNLLAENGGPISITKNWAKSLLRRMNFVKRKGSTAAKMTVENFEAIKEQFLLVFNWDQTAISIVPGSSWTLELKGAKRVEITGISDKRQITAVFCGTLTGEFLPPQLIYQGKTKACLPHVSFPDDWHVTYTPNHWSNEEKMKEYLEQIILPYVRSKRSELKLLEDQPALAIFDVFKGQQTDDVLDILHKNNIDVVCIPANCTDRLQPMDLSINKTAKDFMRNKFKEWYASEVLKQMEAGAETISPVDLKLSTLKPLGARWLISLYDHLKERDSIITNGFKAAGIKA